MTTLRTVVRPKAEPPEPEPWERDSGMFSLDDIPTPTPIQWEDES